MAAQNRIDGPPPFEDEGARLPAEGGQRLHLVSVKVRLSPSSGSSNVSPPALEFVKPELPHAADYSSVPSASRPQKWPARI